MRVVVTGHQGFVGHHIARALLDEGHFVVGIDDFRSKVHLAPRGVESHELTIGHDSLAHAVTKAELVVHCAAHADVSRNWSSLDERRLLWESNLMATLALYEQVPHDASLIFISTLAVLGSELSPYAASKLAGECLTRSYAEHRGVRAVVLRLAAVVGSGYHHGHVADFVRMARDGGVVHARSSGEMMRSYVHVRDVAAAVVGAIGRRSHTAHIAGGDWSPRDTVKEMGCEAVWPSNDFGWDGDVAVSVAPLRNASPVCGGVRDALASLGWMAGCANGVA